MFITLFLGKCCTHRPSLLPIGWLSEVFGLPLLFGFAPAAGGEKLIKLGHLEEVKVVTRFP